MATELECKIRVESHDVVRERLRAAGAVYVGRVMETNRIFDRPDGSLRQAGCGLRVRSIVVLDGEGPSASLTFKGPTAESAFKEREEIEIGVDSPNKAARLLASLGYELRVLFEKRRESWTLGPCHVELDDLPQLGLFVEVEGPNASAVQATLESLELAASDHIQDSYVSMIAAMKGETANEPLTLRFE